MNHQRNPFPPNVVTYIRQLIDRRTGYKERLEQTPEYPGYDDFYLRQNQAERRTLQNTIADIDRAVIAIVQKHMASIEIDKDPEITIANILSALPEPHEVRHITQVSARGQA